MEEGRTIQWPKDKGQTTIYKTLHRKLKIEQHEPHLKPGKIMCSGRLSRFCSTIRKGHLIGKYDDNIWY